MSIKIASGRPTLQISINQNGLRPALRMSIKIASGVRKAGLMNINHQNGQPYECQSMVQTDYWKQTAWNTPVMPWKFCLNSKIFSSYFQIFLLSVFIAFKLFSACHYFSIWFIVLFLASSLQLQCVVHCSHRRGKFSNGNGIYRWWWWWR